MKNVGQVTASNTRVRWRGCYFNGNDIAEHRADLEKVILDLAFPPECSRSTVAPNDTLDSSSDDNEFSKLRPLTVTPALLAMIEKKEFTIAVCGKSDYTDDSGSAHQSTFCTYFIPGHFPPFVDAPFGNKDY